MAYPIKPVIIPDNITALFFKLVAASGTKGGENIAETEVIIIVSTSILKSMLSKKWIKREPKTAIETYRTIFTLFANNF